MTVKNSIKYLLSLIIIVFGIWYFLIKDYDYKITFKSKQATGTIYSNILGWNNWENPNVKAVETLSKVPFSDISQQLNLKDSTIKIDWNFKKINDTTTKITAYLKDTDHSLKQKILVPFKKTDFVKRSLKTLKEIQYGLTEYTKVYKVSKIEKATLEEKFCVYIPVECKMEEKANNMIRNVSYIMNFIRTNNLELVGDPFLQITDWNIEENMLKFDFCFPIKYQTELPESVDLFFKKTKEQSALKTIFNGNYRISDRAWFTIIDYAERNNININRLPTEIYKNDPHAGGDELKWVAEIYVAIID